MTIYKCDLCDLQIPQEMIIKLTLTKHLTDFDRDVYAFPIQEICVFCQVWLKKLLDERKASKSNDTV